MIPIRSFHAAVLERYSLAEVAEPIALTLSMDETWSPRIQGEMILAAHAIQWPDTATEKRQGDWLTIELVTHYGPTFSIASLTAAHGPTVAAWTTAHGGNVEAVTRHHTAPWYPGEELQPLAAATTLWGGAVAAVTAAHGGTIEQVTRALRVPGGSYLIPPSERMLARVKKRTVTPNLEDGTVTYEFASDDIRLHEFRRAELTIWMSETTSIRALVGEMFAYLGGADGPPEIAPGPDIAIPPGTDWLPTQTIWEALSPVLEAAGYELWADLDGTFRLGPRITTTAPIVLDADSNLISYEPVENLTTSYADGGIVEYTDGVTEADKYDVYLMPNASRILHETRPGIKPLSGAAEHLVQRARARGATANAATIAELQLRPGHRAQIRPGTTPRYGTVESLSWDYQTAETTLNLRDINTV